MKNLHSLILLLPALLFAHTGQSQSTRPVPKVAMVITGIDNTSAAAGTQIAISGRGFPSGAGDVVIFFGGTGVKGPGAITGSLTGKALTTSPFLIHVEVPVGTTYDNLTVIDTNTGESATSFQQFGLNFSGSGQTSSDSFEPDTKTFDMDYAVRDMAVCDFNSDGQLDIAFAHHSITPEEGTPITYVTLMVNAVEDTNIGQPLEDNAFVKNTAAVVFGDHTGYITCADIDGNGKPDIIASQASEMVSGEGGQGTASRVYVALNNTPDPNPPTIPSPVPTFQHNSGNIHQSFLLPPTGKTVTNDDGTVAPILRGSSIVAVKDVDGDGRLDLVVNNETDGRVFIYRNVSTGATTGGYKLADEHIEVPVPTTENRGLQAMDIKDMNEDGKPELVIAESGGSQCFVLINESSPGKIAFEKVAITRTVEGTNLQYVAIGDLNNNGKPDLVFSSSASGKDGSSELLVFENMTTKGGKPSLAEQPLRMSVPEGNMRDIDIGDVNGDGWQDIAMSFHHDEGHEGGSEGKKVFVMENKAAAGEIGLRLVPLERNFSAVSVKVADLNRDGRPDLIFAHQTKAKDGVMGVMINKQCIQPKLNPSDDNLVVCAGAEAFNLEVLPPTQGGWLSYQWESKSGAGGTYANAPATSTSRTYNLRDAALLDGNHTLRAKINIGSACETFTSEVTVEKKTDTITVPTLAATPREFCEGTTSRLPVPTAPAGATHTWRGPNDYESTEETPSITDPTPEHAGEYVYFYTTANCRSPEASVTMSVKSVPHASIGIENDESSYVCQGETISKTLEVKSEEDLTGVEYAWKKNKMPIAPAATTPNYTASEAGKYTVNVAKDGCDKDATEVDIRALLKPEVDFLIGGENDLKRNTCIDVSVPFIPKVNNPNTDADDIDFVYEWDFGDTSERSEQENVSHTYAAKGNYKVSLKVGYDAVDRCEKTTTKTITLVDAPNFFVVRNPDLTEKCPLDEISLSAPTTLDIGDSQKDINSYTWNTGGTDRVIAVKKPGWYSVRVENVDTGCTSSASTEIKNKNNSGVSISTDANFVERKDEDEDILHLKPLDERTRVVLTIENVQNQDQNSVLGWSRTVGLDRKDQIKPVLTAYYDPEASSPYTYTVTAVDNSGCEDTAHLSLPIRPDPLPQGDRLFSPNGDGVGDRWKLLKIDLNDRKCDLSIYDRRGKLLFQQKSLPKEWLGWNGTLDGRELEQDVYYYVVECACTGQTNCPRRNSGSILLFR